MNRKLIAFFLISCSCVFAGTAALAADDNLTSSTISPQMISTNRLSGQTRYETAKVIAEFCGYEKVKNVILSTGNEFADALSASVLAHEKQAPILLVDTSVDRSKDAFEYILQHLDSNGTVYIIGGDGIIETEFETKLNDFGFENVVRIAGLDRYDTSYKIADSLQESTGSTVVISSGEQYPDALSISSFAANNGWPILLSPHEALPQEIKNFLLAKKPANVYITGGVGAIADNVQSEIRSLLPQSRIERLTGQTRFETNVRIAETFAPNPSTLYLATGYGFADAMAGSVLAAKNGDPILFVDASTPTLPQSVASYIGKLYAGTQKPNIIALGGNGVVSDEVLKCSSDLIAGTAKEDSIYSVGDITATVAQNEAYTLPATIQATLHNSDIMEVPVRWNPELVDTGSIGSSVYAGVIDGYGQGIKLNLTVKELLVDTVPGSGLLAQYSTQFNSTLVNRTANIRLAAKALNGKRLAPGEEFSFNESVGERTVAAGYKEAMIIEGNSYTPGLGGGVCQVSSTLYNAVMLARLDILERHRHSLLVDYVPAGQDATVSYGTLDFRFRNSTDANLLICSAVEGNTLTFQLYTTAEN